MPKEFFDSIHDSQKTELKESDRNITGANGAHIKCHGMSEINFSVEGTECKQWFYVCENDVTVLLGRGFMKKYDVHTRPATNEIKMRKRRLTTYDLKGARVCNRVAFLRTYTLKPGEEVQLPGQVRGKGNPENIICQMDPSRSIFLRTGALVARTCVKPTKGKCAIRVVNATEGHVTVYKNMTAGVLTPVQRIMPYETKSSEEALEEEARVLQLCEDDSDLDDALPADMSKALADNAKEFTIPEHVLLDREATRRYLRDLQQEARDKHVHEQRVKHDEIPEHVRDLYERTVKVVPKDYRKRIHEVLQKHANAFARDAADIGRTTWVKHDIDTGNNVPVRQRPRRIRLDQRAEVRKQIEALAELGLIRPSTSEWASNVVLVKKKDQSWRMCIDYRELNAKTVNPDTYMLPRIDDTLDALHRAKFFCTLDIQQGYHNVELAEKAKHKTAFHVPCCNPTHWEWNFMPFGLVRAPRTFQRLMDRILRGLEHKIALAYLDDIIVYGSTMEETLTNLSIVLGRLEDAGVKLKAKKCFLFQQETTYLGHVISSQGVKTDPIKTEAVRQWHAPKNVRHVRSFLGMVCYYNKFIKNYARIAMPLYELLGKKKKWEWSATHQEAFEKLKEALVSAPILAYPRPEGRYILDTDASNFAYGAVLSQIQRNEKGEDEEKVIAYYSKTFNGAEQRYCARRRELLAIVRACKHFDVYVRGPEITIRTDHASLQYLKTLQNMTDQMYRWVLFLEQYSYTIEIRAGKLHTNADTLSRFPCNGLICICDKVEQFEKRAKTSVGSVHHLPETGVYAIKFMPQWSSEQIATYQKADPDLKLLYKAKLAGEERPKWNDISPLSPMAKAYYAEWKRLEIWRGVLYRRWENHSGTETRLQLVVPIALQRMICKEVHDGDAACHLGKKRVMRLLVKRFYWYRMDHDVGWWIRTCDTCQRRKRPAKTPKAPMTINLSGFPNETVSMDFMGPFNTTNRGNKHVLCITDHFSRYARAYALPDQTAQTVAACFVDRWICEDGEPYKIHTDQGANFESDLIKEVCKLHKIGKTRTSPYHPQGNAVTERYNQSITDIVAKLVKKEEFNWDSVLPKAVAAYNSTEHSMTQFTPMKLFKNREAVHNIDKMLPRDETNQPETYDEFIQRMDEETRLAYEIAREVMGRSAKITKKYYDKNSHLNKHKVGDPVMIRQVVIRADKGTKKFHDKQTGPWWVVDVMSDVNFRVCRSPDSPLRIVHHDKMIPIERREDEDISWVFEQSRSLDMQRAKEKGFTHKDVVEIYNRLKLLELAAKKEVKKARKRKQPQEQPAVEQPQDGAQPQQQPQEQPVVEQAQGNTQPNQPQDQPVVEQPRGDDEEKRQIEPKPKRKRGRPKKNPQQIGEPDVKATRRSERIKQKNK